MPGPSRVPAVTAALRAFKDARYARTQWLVRSSGETGEVYEWMYPASRSDPARLRAELAERQKKIWDFDVDRMVEEAAPGIDSNPKTERHTATQVGAQ
ncbi:Uu.00g035670.m01.CDS01 [Anthostomella pinea]|uniref:Uu.00g035670.m01.CDS01 n=1 Tax=Anthostomella pinea TaxID=933095 RepID=A0AAI8YB30_9PEZI|nr:Uu.00g035670.m01.CDS01 [Anthostomella pinea]